MKPSPSPASPYYCEIAAQAPEALLCQPGAVFYGPVFFEPHVVCTLTPRWNALNQRYDVDQQDRMVFDIAFPMPPTAFLRPEPVGPLVAPYEELVALAGKMRPVVVLSPRAANTETALVLPSFSLENVKSEELQQHIRANQAQQYFYLPPAPALNMKEAYLNFQRIQPLQLKPKHPVLPKLTHPGNRKAHDPDRRFLRLSDTYFGELKDALRAYLGL